MKVSDKMPDPIVACHEASLAGASVHACGASGTANYFPSHKFEDSVPPKLSRGCPYGLYVSLTFRLLACGLRALSGNLTRLRAVPSRYDLTSDEKRWSA